MKFTLLLFMFLFFTSQNDSFSTEYVSYQGELKEEVIHNVLKNMPENGPFFLNLRKQICQLQNLHDFENKQFTLLHLTTKKESFVTTKGHNDTLIFLKSFYLQEPMTSASFAKLSFNKVEISTAGLHRNKNQILFRLRFLDEKKILFFPVTQLVFSATVVKNFDFNNCFFMFPQEHYRVGEQKDRLVFLELDSEGEIFIKHFSDQTPKTLFEVYRDDAEVLRKIQKYQADSRKIKVGIIDSGIDFNHPVLA